MRDLGELGEPENIPLRIQKRWVWSVGGDESKGGVERRVVVFSEEKGTRSRGRSSHIHQSESRDSRLKGSPLGISERMSFQKRAACPHEDALALRRAHLLATDGSESRVSFLNYRLLSLESRVSKNIDWATIKSVFKRTRARSVRLFHQKTLSLSLSLSRPTTPDTSLRHTLKTQRNFLKGVGIAGEAQAS